MQRASLLLSIGVIGCDVGASPRSLASRAEPAVALTAIAPTTLCVTKGELAGTRVDAPTFRAVARAGNGDAASFRFVVLGETELARPLASGQKRRQLGLKLRAQDSCNLVYVMWRLDPKPMLDVSVKRNPGSRTHQECGARGYTKLRPARKGTLPAVEDGREHELRAEILNDELVAWVDGDVVWHGRLPAAVRKLTGPAGLRADNLAFEIASMATDLGTGAETTCDQHTD